MKKNSLSRREKWARFRFSVISPLLLIPPGPGELQQAIRKIIETPYRHPIHPERELQLKFSTVERWYYEAIRAQDPIAALARKVRSDAGRCRVMNPRLLAALADQYALHPRWTYRLHYDNLAALVQGAAQPGPMPSYATVRRRMQQSGWRKKAPLPRNPTKGLTEAFERLEKREVRSFEATHVHALWHLDFHQGRRRVIDARGEWKTPHLFAALDDRSRVCCHIQWYLSETAETLVHGLTQAFAKRGLPRALMTDNGSAMLAIEVINGLARLAVVHETTLAHSPYQNGKNEFFWSQVEGRFMAMIEGVEPLTLEFLNRAIQAWAEFDYNRKVHEALGTSPLERFLEEDDVSRPAPNAEAMRRAFSVRETRTQRRSDGTISLKGVRFEVPSRFRHIHRLAIEYQSWDLSRAAIVDPLTDTLLADIFPLDKERNAGGRRRCLEPLGPVDPPLEPKSPDDALPPLMRRLLEQYAATGLPPAYLPKEEVEENNDES